MKSKFVRFEVLLIKGVEWDLEVIYDYIFEFDCVVNVDYVFDQLMYVVESLLSFFECGSFLKELVSFGIKEYCQMFFKFYCVIYCVVGQQVLIYVIVDGCCDM